MEITLRPSKELAQDVWEAELDPGDLSIFGKPLVESGPISVIQVSGGVTAGEHDMALRFDHRHARVLNLGQSSRAVVIANSVVTSPGSPADPGHPGDQRFLAELHSAGPDLHQIGSKILGRVRTKYPDGDLSYYETSRRYVETPDNCWAVKVQPRARSLVFTLRGKPELFSAIRGLTFAPDRGGWWSRTTISAASQIDDAVTAIMRARRKDS